MDRDPPPRKPKQRLDHRAVAAHEAACARGEAGYLDPSTGSFVMSEAGLRARETCCGNACRHCPYDWSNVPHP